MTYFPKGACPEQKTAICLLHTYLNVPVPVRVGETAVVSTKVHLQDPTMPQKVTAVMNADAGQVFYRRDRPNEVIHIDVFHSEGQVNPQEVARSIVNRLCRTEMEATDGSPAPPLKPFLPSIDIQTALGGGRVDGPLAYGREPGVRQAHITHVHLAMLNVDVLVSSIFDIVAAVEQAVKNAGLELRKVSYVDAKEGNSPVDLTDYMALSDSLLKGPGKSHQGNLTHTPSWYRAEALARQAAKIVGTTEETLDLFAALSSGMHPDDLAKFRGSRYKKTGEIRRELLEAELIRWDRNMYKLTPQGETVLEYLRRHRTEIESYLRRLLWSLPAKNLPAPERTGTATRPAAARSRGYALPKHPGDMPAHLAVAESIIAKGPTVGGLRPEHLRFWYAREKKSRPLVLLLDASASMAGKRIAAAKEFARHLIVTSKEKVCVVVFQDSGVEVVCDFTKNLRKLEAGLARVRAEGLTPMAMGLEKVVELCKGKLNKPLVLCVTDGIPTVPYRTMSPIEDALAAARKLAKHGIRMGCIGLQPNHGFLKELARAAKGSLYIVDELDASTMAAIARNEQRLSLPG